MYYHLLSALKRRVVLELQDSFSRHPVYEKLVPFIQNKFAFDERPQFGIVVKGSSGNKAQLSADNFVGVVTSHVMLAYFDKPAFLLEWVREDTAAVRANEEQMPTRPGIYYIECTKAPTNAGEEGEFFIDPLLTVSDEPLLLATSGVESEAQLQNTPVQGTVRLWENHHHPLFEGRDFTVDYQTGLITFKTRFLPTSVISAQYRFAAASIGPVAWQWNKADWNTLPGVVLAFGKRGKVGDKQAIVVYEDRVDVANAFGGKFDVSFDLDVIATDPEQMEEIADYTVMALWGEKRAQLSTEGIEVTEVSLGGEAEESYDEQADINYYNASLSIQIQSNWEIHIPLPFTISHATTTRSSDEASVDADRRAPAQSGIVPMNQGGLFFATVPIVVGRNNFYERIA